MAWKHGRTVVHYKDGSTMIEDRNDGYWWDNLLKYIVVCYECGCQDSRPINTCSQCGGKNLYRRNMIHALGITFDPINLWDDEWETIGLDGLHYGQHTIRRPWGYQIPIEDRLGRHVRIPPIEHTMIGSNKYNYFFWQEKMAEIKLGGKGGGDRTYGMRIGKVTSPDGHCDVIETKFSRAVKMYSTTVKSLNLNLELLDLKDSLKDCGLEIGTRPNY